jgi:hypothetical protein
MTRPLPGESLLEARRRLDRELETLPAPAQEPQGDRHVARRPAQIGIADSPFLTVAEAARFCRFDATANDPEDAFRQWARRQGLPIRRRGRFLMVERRVLETFLSVRVDHYAAHDTGDHGLL